MQPQLDSLMEQFAAAGRRVQLLADRLSDAQWATRREPTRWSPAECIVHLNLTSAACLPLIDAGLNAAAELPPMMRDRYRRDALGWLISTMTGPMKQSGRLRLGAVKTSAEFEPKGDLARAVVLADFARLQVQQIAAVKEAEDMPIDQVKVQSPFDARFTYNLFSLLCILPNHQLRHIVQAEHVWS